MKVVGHNNKIVLAGGKALEAAAMPNLFDPSASGVEHNKRLTSSGGVGNSTGFCVSDYIEVDGADKNTLITLWQNTSNTSNNYDNNTVICAYNSSKSFLYAMKAGGTQNGTPSGTSSSLLGNDCWIIRLPDISNVKYIRVMGKEDNYTSIKVYRLDIDV